MAWPKGVPRSGRVMSIAQENIIRAGGETAVGLVVDLLTSLSAASVPTQDIKEAKRIISHLLNSPGHGPEMYARARQFIKDAPE